MASILGLMISTTLLHALAIATTCYRLGHRYNIRRLSWDDACAGFAALLVVGEILCLWFKVKIDNEIIHDTPEYKQRQSIIYWCTTIHSTFILCFTRISLWLSIRRISAPGCLRKWCIPMAIVTALTSLVVVTLKGTMCTVNPTTPDRGFPVRCISPIPFLSLQTTADVGMSLLLVVVPVISLWNMNLPSGQRYFMISLFATSLLTVAAALTHNILVIERNRVLHQFTMHFEAAIALLVCNTHVVATSLYSHRRHPDCEDDDITHPSFRTLVASMFNNDSNLDCPAHLSSDGSTKMRWSHDETRHSVTPSSIQTELTFTDFSASLVQSTSVPTLTTVDKNTNDDDDGARGEGTQRVRFAASS
ncbi:hypothetical protein Moror_1021 [Moniliophthora roreri MCA 2997]|uniref:Rhodopsin domain-containing protein n=2 Tax=Moniliophthora roreri TaxID=221103 RepID=V2X7R0_MONRO|nr:hypothetical protein Moror_1021 [Moniliophthora roreri MCA 2997]KAI3616140.1 hypothetical protein WG66_013875 [Moniliophthora roreri]